MNEELKELKTDNAAILSNKKTILDKCAHSKQEVDAMRD